MFLAFVEPFPGQRISRCNLYIFGSANQHHTAIEAKLKIRVGIGMKEANPVLWNDHGDLAF